MIDKDKIAFLFDVLKRYDNYIATTNFKSGLILSFLGVVILGVAKLAKDLTSGAYDCAYLVFIVCSILTIAFAMISIYKLLRAVTPRIMTSSNSLIFFGSVSKLENSEEYSNSINQLTEGDIIQDLSRQVYEVAKITNLKFIALKSTIKLIIFTVLPLLSLTLFLSLFVG